MQSPRPRPGSPTSVSGFTETQGPLVVTNTEGTRSTVSALAVQSVPNQYWESRDVAPRCAEPPNPKQNSCHQGSAGSM